jgi:putative endonuclease
VIVAERRPDPRQALGRLGETAAAHALERAGLRVIERRYRRRVGEIDIIADRGELLVFVEVKTRRSDRYGTPGESITMRQRRRIARAALDYLTRKRWLERPCRFDVVEVYATTAGISRVRHIEGAFHLDRDP